MQSGGVQVDAPAVSPFPVRVVPPASTAAGRLPLRFHGASAWDPRPHRQPREKADHHPPWSRALVPADPIGVLTALQLLPLKGFRLGASTAAW